MKTEFRAALSKRFDVDFQGRANWYLQAAISSDKDGNLYLDQRRYAASIVERYIPTAVVGEPTVEDKQKDSSPLPSDFKWTKEDNLPEGGDLKQVETEFGFRMIELAGSLNYLAHTAVVAIFAIHKMCRFTGTPWTQAFQSRTALVASHHVPSSQSPRFLPQAREFPVLFGLVASY